MALEIERKFLLLEIPEGTERCLYIEQAYLQASPERSVRLRITEQPDHRPMAEIAIKGPAAPGHFTRAEFEYRIPVADARTMMTFCDHAPITKWRYHYRFAGHLWELDAFSGANAGLLIAEIELTHEDEHFERPPFLLQEVTGDPRYFNLALAYRPFSTWSTEEEETV